MSSTDAIDAKSQYLQGVHDLHEQIENEVNKSKMDPGRLMRLMAIGINHCLVGIANLMTEEDD